MDTRNWELCFICQVLKEAATNHAMAIRYRNNVDMLRSFLSEIVQNLPNLHKLDELSISAVIKDIFEKEHQETVDNMLKNTVRFHKIC